MPRTIRHTPKTILAPNKCVMSDDSLSWSMERWEQQFAMEEKQHQREEAKDRVKNVPTSVTHHENTNSTFPWLMLFLFGLYILAN